MSLKSRKSGNQFGSVKLKETGTLTAEEWAIHMLIAGFPPVPRVIAEGLGTIFYESSFNASSEPAGNEHIGGWAESPAFGTRAERLRAGPSTKAAYKNWKENKDKSGSLYGNFHQAWGQWQAEQREDGVAGETQYRTYLGDATRAIEKVRNGSVAGGGPSDGGGWIGGVPDPGDLIEGAGSAVSAAMDAGEFLAEMASTFLSFRKLGQLGAEAFAWFLRLLLKSIWTYAIAPAWHWAQRAETYYWRNFFGVGTERGSGNGHLLRENAGIVTIGFWAIGYAILWTDGESLSPSKANETLLGRTVKGVEGKIASRNLIKPDKVKEKTPTKPEPQTSSVKIERVAEMAVSRKRPVSVQSSDGSLENTTGRKDDERNQRGQTKTSQTTPKENGESRLILPESVKREKAEQEQKINAKAAAKRDAGMDSSDSGGEPSKGNRESRK